MRRALAETLAERSDVAGLRYPGLPVDPSHAPAVRPTRRFGPVVSFRLADKATAERFLAELRLVDDATSFAGRSFHRRTPGALGWGRGTGGLHPVLGRCGGPR